MDLAWLEDLLTVAEMGHYARAAEVRNVSQSALSRRIQSLERWAGVELLDRSAHPIRLTKEGRLFATRAREIVISASKVRADLRELNQLSEARLSISCLHSLALNYVPAFIRRLQAEIGPFEASVIAETRTIDDYLDALLRHETDVFLCFTHPKAPMGISLDGVSHVQLGMEQIAPYQSTETALLDLSDDDGAAIPYLQYKSSAFMSRIVDGLLGQAPLVHRLNPVLYASLAASLCSAAAHGMGVAWLPQSTAVTEVRAGRLQQLQSPFATHMPILAFRSRSNRNPQLDRMWEVLEAWETGPSPLSSVSIP